jgi:hypothetical protein
MPRISASVPPPPLAPPLSVRAQRRATPRSAPPGADPVIAPPPASPDAQPPTGAEPAPPDTTPVPPAALDTGAAAAAATIARLQPVTDLLAALGKTETDLDRWLASGFGLRTYRTPDGDRFADPAELLAALTECRPTPVASNAGDKATAVAA